MIRTASQILAEIGYDKQARRDAVRQARQDATPRKRTFLKRPCKAPKCHNTTHRTTYCSGHYIRWLKHGDILAHIPLRCRCGNCPATIQNRQQKARREQRKRERERLAGGGGGQRAQGTAEAIHEHP